MERGVLGEAVALLERANSLLAPMACTTREAKALLAAYTKAEKLVAYGKATLSARLGDAAETARLSGTSIGRARQTINAGRAVASQPAVSTALQEAAISLKVLLQRAVDACDLLGKDF